jgi:transcriptional regulatory protein LevR/transcriptional regulator with AAA-type ATPase domain
MKRIDLVFEKLKELNKETGVSAGEIADALGLDRANVSKDLNLLADEGRVEKTKGKPVLFSVAEVKEQKKHETVLDRFADKNPSLFPAIKQAKAAVLYPPKGMHILILGETGVGKSMFAGIVHKYAIEMGKLQENSPFIVFNCADYANNSQLLLSQLFGAKKGAYTGADSDKPGLVEKANEGILFLDEVHRLPPEGQEMFFTFMDRGTYRRLGETDVERIANVLIISATTENPDSSLLKTFTRRIPMIIRIPSLKERSLDEKFNLITEFMRGESFRLGKEIKVSVNSMRAFLSYECENNVGQLKTDIQLACAKAYADFVSNNKEAIEISSIDLPQYIRQGLYMETEHRQIWNRLIGITRRFCVFDEGKESMLFEEKDNEENIYEMIDMRVHELRSRGLGSDKLEREMEKDIEDYFKTFIHSVNRKIDISNLESVIEPGIIMLAEEIVRLSEEALKKKLSERVYYGIAVHIANSIDRIKKNRKIINLQLNKIRTEHSTEFNVALDCLKIIDRTLDISMPIDEAGFLTMFLVYDDRDVEEQKKDVRVIVIAHGETTATSMVNAANMLLGVEYAIGINAPLEEKPQQIILKVRNCLKEQEIKSDVLFLVDMGSLTNFGKEIEEEIGIKTRTISLVSTLHVIEATRKAMMGHSLDEVYRETLSVNTLLQNELLDKEADEEGRERLAIVTICTTGEGSAITIKNVLYKQLEFDSRIFDIIPINLLGKENIQSRLKAIQKEYTVICIVSSFKIDTKILQFDLYEVLNKNAIKPIQRLIDLETTYAKMGDTLENQLTHVNGEEILRDIRYFNNRVSKELDIKINTNFLIGVTFHLACMIDRLKEGGTIDEFEGREIFIKENPELYKAVKNACNALNSKYSIEITEDEICYIMNFFNYKNYI